jgi:hypothetical protein
MLVALCTPEVWIVKLPVVAPPETVTVEGIDTNGLCAERFTTVPPVGAGPPNVTVPVETVPPVTGDGETDRPIRAEGLIVKGAVKTTPIWLAVTVRDVDVLTAAP